MSENQQHPRQEVNIRINITQYGLVWDLGLGSGLNYLFRIKDFVQNQYSWQRCLERWKLCIKYFPPSSFLLSTFYLERRAKASPPSKKVQSRNFIPDFFKDSRPVSNERKGLMQIFFAWGCVNRNTTMKKEAFLL